MINPLTNKDIFWTEINLTEMTKKLQWVIPLDRVLEAKQLLLKKCDRYRLSNELWSKSQDENLSDFEDWIEECFQIEEGEKND